MTEKEALVFLSVDENDDLLSAYESRIFEFKQDFTSKALIPSVLNKKIEKLQKLEDAARVLNLNIENSNNAMSYHKNFSSDILESYLAFEKVNSQFKLDIYRSASAQELIHLLQEFLKLLLVYLKLWPSLPNYQNTVILAKQPDPMDLLSDIKCSREKGIVTFDELANDLTDNFPQLKKESTRLNKLFNMSL